MKKIAFCIILIIIVTGLIMCGCPSPQPTTPTTPTTPATPEHEEYDIVLQGYSVGSSAYQVFFGMGELINKHSPWLRATVVESTSTVENVKLLKDPANKKNLIIHLTDTTFYQTRDGVAPFDSKYTPTIIAREDPFDVMLLTLDPNLKSWQELGGKTAMLLFPGSSSYTLGQAILKMYGILDEVNVVAGGFDKAKDALLDGTIDAGINSIRINPVTLSPPVEELLNRKPTYCIPFPLGEESQVIAELAKEGQFLPFTFKRVPQSEHPLFKNDWVVSEGSLSFACDPEMPDDVVTEFCRILDEYKEEMIQYSNTADNWTTDGFGEVLIEKQYWHPAAIKFWDNLNVPITYQEPPH
jgi:TRAP-type uncharacterized transport system substrate-binding protein